MSDNTKIQWTDATWNPVVGCTKVSAGCKNCYAERMAYRLACMGKEGYASTVTKDGKWNGRTYHLFNNALDKPLHWRNPRRIFVCSMGDLFHPDVPFEFVDKVVATLALCPQHTFQILTKRPNRMLEYFGDFLARISSMTDFAEKRHLPHNSSIWTPNGQVGLYSFGSPVPNLWLGTTCEDQAAADERIPHLLDTPAAVRFVSVEPMLGPVNLREIHLDEFYCPQCAEFFAAPGRWVSPCCGADTSDVGDVNDGTITCTECKDTFASDEDIPECPTCRNHGGGRYIQPDCSCCFSGDLENVALRKLDWVIIGCESGTKRRPCKLEWVRDLIEQCDSAGVLVFVKQLDLKGKVSKNPAEWPEWARRREMPKVESD